MESQVQRHGCEHAPASAGAGRREPAFEADVSGVEPGSQDPQGDCRKKVVEPGPRRVLEGQSMAEQGASERRACQILNVSRSVYRYQAKKTDEPQIKQALL